MVFLLPWIKKYKQSRAKYLNLEWDNMGLEGKS